MYFSNLKQTFQWQYAAIQLCQLSITEVKNVLKTLLDAINNTLRYSFISILYVNTLAVCFRSLETLLCFKRQYIWKYNMTSIQGEIDLCEGELVVKDGGGNYNKCGTGISFIRNGLMYLFSRTEYSIGNNRTEGYSNPGHATPTLVKGLFSYPK